MRNPPFVWGFFKKEKTLGNFENPPRLSFSYFLGFSQIEDFVEFWTLKQGEDLPSIPLPLKAFIFPS